MRSFRTLDRRAGFGLSAFGLLLAMVAPGLVPAIASADTLTDRSIALSSAAKSAKDVTYTVQFTVSSAAAGFTVDFCKNSPIVGTTCTPPTGFDVAGATTDTGTVAVRSANGVSVTTTIAADATVSVVLGSIDNPTVANDENNGFYARIATFADAGQMTSYEPDTTTNVVDSGGVALSITDNIGVSAAVLESMTFCVSKLQPGDGCGASGHAVTAPNLTLGDATTGLDSGDLSTDDIYAQISTNAATGAVVNLKSNAAGCGGLLRAGALDKCDIGPSLGNDVDDTLAQGKALFGLIAAGVTGGTGTIQATNGYDDTTYHMDFVEDEETGVTSTYGSPLFNTNSKPASNKNMHITFGASMSPDTPAGNYSADLSMIATGKY